jgi:hypothetical protein
VSERKAIDALGRYKFQMFGYWAGVWVHLNRIIGDGHPNPFKHLVEATRNSHFRSLLGVWKVGFSPESPTFSYLQFAPNVMGWRGTKVMGARSESR